MYGDTSRDGFEYVVDGFTVSQRGLIPTAVYDVTGTQHPLERTPSVVPLSGGVVARGARGAPGTAVRDYHRPPHLTSMLIEAPRETLQE